MNALDAMKQIVVNGKAGYDDDGAGLRRIGKELAKLCHQVSLQCGKPLQFLFRAESERRLGAVLGQSIHQSEPRRSIDGIIDEETNATRQRPTRGGKEHGPVGTDI